MFTKVELGRTLSDLNVSNDVLASEIWYLLSLYSLF